MSRRKVPGVQEDVQCNLIPMIDIMFLLLLFFMLSADMGQREFADVILPQADQVKGGPQGKERRRVHDDQHLPPPESADFSCPLYAHGAICRDASHWLVSLRGKDYTRETVRDQLKIEADASLEPDIDKDAASSSRRATSSSAPTGRRPTATCRE